MTEPALAPTGEAMSDSPAERIRLDIQLTAAVKLKLLPPADQKAWDEEQIRTVARELSTYLTEVYEISARPLAAADCRPARLVAR